MAPCARRGRSRKTFQSLGNFHSKTLVSAFLPRRFRRIEMVLIEKPPAVGRGQKHELRRRRSRSPRSRAQQTAAPDPPGQKPTIVAPCWWPDTEKSLAKAAAWHQVGGKGSLLSRRKELVSTDSEQCIPSHIPSTPASERTDGPGIRARGGQASTRAARRALEATIT